MGSKCRGQSKRGSGSLNNFRGVVILENKNFLKNLLIKRKKAYG